MSTTTPIASVADMTRGPGVKVTSSFCARDEPQCVEVMYEGGDGAVIVTDSKDEDGEPLVFSAAEWDAFIAGVKNGEFDRDALEAVGGTHSIPDATPVDVPTN
jgi:hypothetical protein